MVQWPAKLPKKSFNLTGSSAIIIGQGNVAVDVTRILSKPISELEKTDITQNAINHLKDSAITDVYMIGRRGPAQSAFVLELKELGHIDGNLKIHDELALSAADLEEIEQSSKARKNIEELKSLKNEESNKNSKTIHIMFYSSPIEIIEKDGVISKVKFEKNRLEGNAGTQKAHPTGETFEISCDLLFRSIGYRGVPFKGLPFDDRTGTIPNEKGQVIQLDGSKIANVFVTGWIKRGPSGVIGTNRSDSIETVETCLQIIDQSTIENNEDIENVLIQKNIQFLSYADWKIIDQYEIEQGEKVGKPREKLTSIDQILAILNK